METTTVLNEAFVLIIKALVIAISTLIVIFLPRLVKKIEEKLGIDIPDSLERQFNDWARLAVAYGEERARAAGKAVASGVEKKVPSLTKLNWAAEWFRANGAEKVVDWTEEEIRDFLMAHLGQQRQWEMPKTPEV